MSYPNCNPTMIALIETVLMAERNGKEMPEPLRSRAAEIAKLAKASADDLIRKACGWGIGDTVELQYQPEETRFEVLGFELLRGRRAGVLLAKLDESGRASSIVHGHGVGASFRLIPKENDAGQLCIPGLKIEDVAEAPLKTAGSTTTRTRDGFRHNQTVVDF